MEGSTVATKEESKAVFKKLLAKPANKMCFDCNAHSPKWADVSFGIFLCYVCAGQHRGYGVHICFVRSTNLDEWTYYQLALMQEGGNDRARRFFRKHGVGGVGKSRLASRGARMYREQLSKMAEKRLEGKDAIVSTVGSLPKDIPSITTDLEHLAQQVRSASRGSRSAMDATVNAPSGVPSPVVTRAETAPPSVGVGLGHHRTKRVKKGLGARRLGKTTRKEGEKPPIAPQFVKKEPEPDLGVIDESDSPKEEDVPKKDKEGDWNWSSGSDEKSGDEEKEGWGSQRKNEKYYDEDEPEKGIKRKPKKKTDWSDEEEEGWGSRRKPKPKKKTDWSDEEEERQGSRRKPKPKKKTDWSDEEEERQGSRRKPKPKKKTDWSDEEEEERKPRKKTDWSDEEEEGSRRKPKPKKKTDWSDEEEERQGSRRKPKPKKKTDWSDEEEEERKPRKKTDWSDEEEEGSRRKPKPKKKTDWSDEEEKEERRTVAQPKPRVTSRRLLDEWDDTAPRKTRFADDDGRRKKEEEKEEESDDGWGGYTIRSFKSTHEKKKKEQDQPQSKPWRVNARPPPGKEKRSSRVGERRFREDDDRHLKRDESGGSDEVWRQQRMQQFAGATSIGSGDYFGVDDDTRGAIHPSTGWTAQDVGYLATTLAERASEGLREGMDKLSGILSQWSQQPERSESGGW